MSRTKAGRTGASPTTIEPTGLEERHGRSLMRGILAGDFPGSPVDLTYDFRVVDDAIESLRIHP